MKTFWLTRDQYIPFDLETVFGFFSDAMNLDVLTPPWLHFEVLTPPSGPVASGTLINYKLRLRGIPIRWQSEITEWEPPYRFVDEQRKGPYRLWRHDHHFEALGDGTVVTDRVTYRITGGEPVDRFLVRPDLERIFDYRARKLDEWVLEQKRRAVAFESTMIG